jgi:Mrp family chromosome partitioning ATPase
VERNQQPVSLIDDSDHFCSLQRCAQVQEEAHMFKGMKVIAVAINKGGAGKTTTAVAANRRRRNRSERPDPDMDTAGW